MKTTIWLLIGLFATASVCDAAKILAIFPYPEKSHAILGNNIVTLLLKDGHEVTYITPFPKNVSNPKVHIIDVSDTNFDLEDDISKYTVKFMMYCKPFISFLQPLLLFVTDHVSKVTLDNENVQKLLKDKNQHFDMVISDWTFNELNAGLAGLYDAHLVWVATFDPHWMILQLVDDYPNPAYTGYIVDGCTPFTLFERVYELWFTYIMTFFKEVIANYLQTRAYNNIIAPLIKERGRVAPYFSELRYNASLVLGNSHVSTGDALRLPQNYKPVGGYHIDEEVKPLPEDLQKLLDDAKDGLIYFSMGAGILSKDLPDEIKSSILQVFATLKQTVLWKYEEYLLGLPKNVHAIKWAPQQSILAHPNCVLFITHGGMLSMLEAVAAGKPILGVPLIGDQLNNVARAVSRGMGRRVDLSYSMHDAFKTEIAELLNNATYAQRAKELSFIYHDRPATPGQELVHWVNHVLKTGGAHHMRSPALMVPWYQKYYLDLIFIILLPGIIYKRVQAISAIIIESRSMTPIIDEKKDD